jgi:hypothetical protein
VAMTAQGAQQRALLPGLPGPALVRYRVIGKRADGTAVVISPRPSDPYGYHRYFVESDPAPPAGAYQIFIAPARWTEMWSNLGGGPNAGCEVNPSWDSRVPAVVIHADRVHDVLVRYQGSRYQRRNGFRLPPMTSGMGPAQPTDFKALSWRLSFPNHDRWVEGPGDQRETVTLNKQHQACPGVLNLLSSKLHWAAGVRTQRFRFARLYVNGSYYHYMMEVEDIDEDMLGKTDAPGVGIGDLFKSDGAVDDQGPWGRGNFRPLQVNPSCPDRWSKLDRYRTTFERQSHEWKSETAAGHQEVITMIEGLAPLYGAAQASGNWGPVREHLERHFDVPQLLTHWAVRNFAGVWDDGVHNFYLYKRASDGKYEVLPQDFDLEFGGHGQPPTTSIYAGEEGAGEDPVGGINWLKSALIKAFRTELRARLAELLGTVLSEKNVLEHLNQALAAWDQKAWDESPAMARCDATARVASARAWLTTRYAYLAQQGLR